MVFQLFTSILASIVAFFGAIVPLNDDVKHWFSDITVGKTLDTVLPADAHPVSAAELKDVRSGNWMSVVRPQTTTMFFGDYYRDAPKNCRILGKNSVAMHQPIYSIFRVAHHVMGPPAGYGLTAM